MIAKLQLTPNDFIATQELALLQECMGCRDYQTNSWQKRAADAAWRAKENSGPHDVVLKQVSAGSAAG